MFRNKLTEDLKTIFRFTKVRFQGIEFGQEEEVLFVHLNEVKPHIEHGVEYATITGSIGCVSYKHKFQSGYLKKMYDLAPIEIKKTFYLLGTENVDHFSDYDDNFTKYTINFLYLYKNDYNPAKLTTGIITRFINQLKGVF